MSKIQKLYPKMIANADNKHLKRNRQNYNIVQNNLVSVDTIINCSFKVI